MGRSRETYSKKEVRNKKEKRRKEKEKKRLARKEEKEKKSSLDDMIAYVDENGIITSTPPDPKKRKTEIAVEDIEVSVARNKSIEDLDELRNGTLINLFESRGYGFIKDSETQVTLFARTVDFMDDIRVNDNVSFKAEKGKKGPIAVQVSLLK